MDKSQAVKMLQVVEKKAREAGMTGAFEDAGGYLYNVFMEIAATARQQQWLDEDTYRAVVKLDDAENMDVVGCAASMLLVFISESVQASIDY